MKRVVDVPERDFGIYFRMVEDGMANEAIRRIVKGQPLFEILDKISAEISNEAKCTMNDNRASGLWKAYEIIEKYKGVSE